MFFHEETVAKIQLHHSCINPNPSCFHGMATLTGIPFIILSTLLPYFFIYFFFNLHAMLPHQKNPRNAFASRGNEHKRTSEPSYPECFLLPSFWPAAVGTVCVQQIRGLDITNNSMVLWVSCFLSATLSSRPKCHSKCRKTQATTTSQRLPELLNIFSWHFDHKIPHK